MVPNSVYGDCCSVENDRYQDTDNVDFQQVNEHSNSSPVMSASAEVHAESGAHFDEPKDVCCEQVLQDRDFGPQSVGYAEVRVRMNVPEVQPSVQWHSCLPVTSGDAEDEYLEPVGGSASRKESSRYQDRLPLVEDSPRRNDEYQEDNIYVSVDDVRGSEVMGEARAAASISANQQIVPPFQSETVSKVCIDVDAAAETVATTPVYDSIYEGKISDAQRLETNVKSLHHAHSSFGSSISTGEVVVDTGGIEGCTDIDAVVRSVAAAVPVYDSIGEGKTRIDRMCKSTDRSSYHVQPTVASSISRGEVIIDTRDTEDSLETGVQCPVDKATSSSPSATEDHQPDAGSCQIFSVLLTICFKI